MLELANTIFNGVWKLFQLNIPGINVSFFTVLAAIFIVKIVIVAIKMIFHIDSAGDKT